MTRILVTGSESVDLDTVTAALMRAWLDLGKPTRPVLVHSGNPGAEKTAADLWRLWGWPVENRGTRPVDTALVDVVLAFPGSADLTGARVAGLPVRLAVERNAA